MKEGTELVDSHSPWYRWKTRISGKELMDTLYEKLCDRYEQEPSNVQIRNKEGKFFSGRPETLQEIQSISVIQRGRSGVVKCLEIVDKDQVIRVFPSILCGRYWEIPVCNMSVKMAVLPKD